MIPFKEISLADKLRVQSYTLTSIRQNCDMSFSNLYSWHFLYQTRIAEKDGFLLIKFYVDGQPVYMMPVGEGEVKPVIEALIDDARSENCSFRMQGVCANMRSMLETVMPGRFEFTADRDFFDYIYLRTDLATLKGKRYQPKRNHVNRFVRSYPNYEYKELVPELVPECLTLAHHWCLLNETDDRERRELEDELKSLSDALNHFGELGLSGGVLHVDGRIVAFTFGTPINQQTFDVCVEKADVEVEGAYTMINYEFARHIPDSYIYINREEDLGLEGLRKAKLSYHPCFLLEKYTALLKN